jgi:hypothetical protein
MTLTLNRLLVYTVRLATILFTLGFMVGCGSPVECDANGDCMKNLIGSQTAVMTRTPAVGTAAGGLPDLSDPNVKQVNSLQQQELEPQTYTIQFQVEPPSDGNGFGCFAIVNWKVKGQQIVRKLSVYSGASISAVAESVDVQLIDVSGAGLAGLPPNNGGQYKVAANLSRGTRANVQQPPTLITQPLAVEFLSAPSVEFLVPQDAGVISAMVLVAPANLQDIIAQQLVTGGPPTQSYYPATQPGEWIPVSPLTLKLNMINRNLVDDPPLGNVIWGIEG